MMRKKLGEILVDAGLIDGRALQAALAEQQRWGGPLGRVLIDMNLISEEVLVVALSKQMNFPTVDLDKVEVSQNTLELVDGQYAEHYGIVPIKSNAKFLDVAMTDPTQLGVLDELRIRTKLNIRPYITGPKAMERALDRLYGRGVNPLSQRAGEEQFFPAGMRVLELGDEKSAPHKQPMRAPTEGHTSRAEVEALQRRISKMEAMLSRDEDVLRKLLALLVDKGVASREEILERIK